MPKLGAAHSSKRMPLSLDDRPLDCLHVLAIETYAFVVIHNTIRFRSQIYIFSLKRQTYPIKFASNTDIWRFFSFSAMSM